MRAFEETFWNLLFLIDLLFKMCVYPNCPGTLFIFSFVLWMLYTDVWLLSIVLIEYPNYIPLMITLFIPCLLNVLALSSSHRWFSFHRFIPSILLIYWYTLFILLGVWVKFYIIWILVHQGVSTFRSVSTAIVFFFILYLFLRISCHSFYVFHNLIQRRVITATNRSLLV